MRLRRFIESVADQMEGSVGQPSQSDPRELDAINSFKGRVEWCKSHLGKHIGRGSSRIVFEMPNGHVLKLAFNHKGVLQNEVECGDWYKNSIDCFPDVYNCAEDFTWCEVEKARKCSKSDFPRLLDGVTFDELCDWLIYETRRRGNGRAFMFRHLDTPEERLKAIEDAAWDKGEGLVYDLSEYIGNYGASETLVSDLFTTRNWGVATRDGEERIVIADSGFNDRTAEMYRKGWKR